MKKREAKVQTVVMPDGEVLRVTPDGVIVEA